MQERSQREMAQIIADSTSMTAKDLRAMSTIVLMAAEVALARERGKTPPAPDGLRDAAESAKSWLDNWAQHVGTCPDGQVCTCGLDAIRNELIMSLQPLT